MRARSFQSWVAPVDVSQVRFNLTYFHCKPPNELVMIKNQVDLVSDDAQIVDGEFALWEESPEDPEQVQLDLRIADEVISAVAETFFDALVDLRRRLEHRGLRPKCFGACRDVYPSPMIRSMGSGERAYRLKFGCQVRTEDLVDIFDSGPDIFPASVEEQEDFYSEWLMSLKS